VLESSESLLRTCILLGDLLRNLNSRLAGAIRYSLEISDTMKSLERAIDVLERRHGSRDLVHIRQNVVVQSQQPRQEIVIQQAQQQEVVIQRPPPPPILVHQPASINLIAQQPRQEVVIQQAQQQEVVVQRPPPPSILVHQPASINLIAQQPQIRITIGAQNLPQAYVQVGSQRDRETELKAQYDAEKKRERDEALFRQFNEQRVKKGQEEKFQRMLEYQKQQEKDAELSRTFDKEKSKDVQQDRFHRILEDEWSQKKEADLKRMFDEEQKRRGAHTSSNDEMPTSQPKPQPSGEAHNSNDDQPSSESDEDGVTFDPYEALGLQDRERTPEHAIRSTYSRLALIVHPDKQVGKTAAQRKHAAKRMSEINRAKGLLLDAERRKAYDEVGAVFDWQFEQWKKNGECL
jgi:hypothetical protein